MDDIAKEWPIYSSSPKKNTERYLNREVMKKLIYCGDCTVDIAARLGKWALFSAFFM